LGAAGSPTARRTVYMILGAGQAYRDIKGLCRFVARDGPQAVIDRTVAYWRLWLQAARNHFPTADRSGPAPRLVELYKRSLLILRTQIDNNGAIVAANDSDVMQFSRDTYSYLWPRDG